MRLLIAALLLVCCFPAAAQFAPQAGVSGSTAIHRSSTQIVAWATGCRLQRGLAQIDSPAAGYPTAGDSSRTLGMADGSTVSLGDSGVATLTFARPIQDGPGADFAVFENGFANPANAEEAFLELAFVEVSSDGVHFTRFQATSNTQDTQQIAAAGDYMNARLLNNLAGKYIGSYGTPFDLQELAGTPGLDLNAITYVRIVDVIGRIGTRASRDGNGHAINDPWPTPFAGSGFDLDAVGVLHQQALNVAPDAAFAILITPNPVGETVSIRNAKEGSDIELMDATGRKLLVAKAADEITSLSLRDLAAGLYFITLRTKDGAVCTRPLLHR